MLILYCQGLLDLFSSCTLIKIKNICIIFIDKYKLNIFTIEKSKKKHNGINMIFSHKKGRIIFSVLLMKLNF